MQSLEKNLREDVEVLLIDDGAKDNSGKIADAFAKRYARYVQVIHKTNGGVSSAEIGAWNLHAVNILSSLIRMIVWQRIIRQKVLKRLNNIIIPI